MNAELSIAQVSQERSVDCSLPDYFLCEAELVRRTAEEALRIHGRCSWPAAPNRDPSAVRRSHRHFASRFASKFASINHAAALGGDAGGRRVAMPRLPLVVRAQAHVSRSDQAALPTEKAVGTEHAHQNHRSLLPVRSGVDVTFSQERGALRGAARPTLSFVPATQEENSCSHES